MSGGQDGALPALAMDWSEIVLAGGMTRATVFCDPYQAGLVISLVKAIPGPAAASDGGYPGAARVCPDLHPVDIEPAQFQWGHLE